VDADAGQVGGLGEPVEVVQHVFGSEWLAGGAGEDRVLVVPGRPGGEASPALAFGLVS
jgi:hypothetical protein